MFHSFRIDIATEYGIHESIFLQNLYFWIQKNKANNKHYYDGKYWTYNTQEAFTKLFPYMSQSKVSRMGNKLQELGLVNIGNYNKVGYDRTKWYSLTEKAEQLLNGCNTAIMQSEYSIMQSEYSIMQNELTIPYTNTDTNTDNKKSSASNNAQQLPNNKIEEELFERLWKLYPLKRGKGQVSKSKKKEIAAVGEEQFTRCIKRYKQSVEKERQQGFKDLRYMNGSTFFNSGYVDFLDTEVSDVKKETPIEVKLVDGGYV